MSWIERCRTLLDGAGCTIVRADLSTGINHVLSEIRSTRPSVIWLKLDDLDSDDSVSVGNKFAVAFAQSQGSSMFGYGVPIDHTVAKLKRFHELFGRLYVVVSSAQKNAAAAESIKSLMDSGSDVVLVVAETTSDDQLVQWSASKVVEAADLLLTEAEAQEVALGAMHPDEACIILRQSSWRYVDFAAAVRMAVGLPPLLEPEPNGYSISGGALDELPVDLLISSLRRRGAGIEAFEVCVRWLPELAAELVREAAPQYVANGLSRRLTKQLELLPAALREQSDDLMRWWFGALTTENRHAAIRPIVERVLAERDAPELRALYAAAFPDPDMLRETHRAMLAARTPVTLRMHGFALGQQSSGDAGMAYLMKALRMAEALSDVDQVVAAATDISNYNVRRGRYQDGSEWAKWALDHYSSKGGNDEFRRLAATSLIVYVRILTDDTLGLDDVVQQLRISDQWAGMPTSEGFTSTIGDWHVVSGDLQVAEAMYRRNLVSLPREHYHLAALDLIPILIRLGKTAEAGLVGSRARTITRASDDVTRALGVLANALSDVDTDAKGAEHALEEVVAVLGAGSEAQRLGQAAIALAGLRFDRGDTQGALRALREGEAGLNELGASGWRLLSGGCDRVDRLRALWTGEHDQPQLCLTVMGTSVVRIGARELRLTNRNAECLTIIADRPEGTSLEQLTISLYGDSGAMGTAKALVSRLRNTVPLTSRPYKIAVPFRADFGDILEHLRRGQVRHALNIYQGPLLPHSDAPAIVELRERIDESLRQAVLASGDVDCMMELANRTDAGDLELFEEAYRHLSRSDPRSPLLLARVHQIRREWESDSPRNSFAKE